MKLESDETNFELPPELEPEVLDVKHGLNFLEREESSTLEEIFGNGKETEAGPA